MSSDFMDYLRKDRGEIFFNFLPEGFRQVLPEAFGSHEVFDEQLSCIRAVSSCRACGVSLLSVLSHGWGTRFVADTASLSSMPSRYTTSM